MSLMQRRKGQAGERELAALIADLTGWDVRRRVRQHDGDSDLEGVPGWSIECKRHAKASRGDIVAWWKQTVLQATKQFMDRGEHVLPVLFYRANRADWVAVFPMAPLMTMQTIMMWESFDYTFSSSVEAWAAVAREVDQNKGA